jgi:energy-coupling factor transporter ATP-binding protein EcfA2
MLPNITTPNATLENPGTITVIVGRNGSGKSRFLRTITKHLNSNKTINNVSYITPERASLFQYHPNTDHNINQDPNWLYNDRLQNQSSSFKLTAASTLKRLELLWGRKLDNNQALRATEKTFQTEYLDKINKLFLNIKIVRGNGSQAFEFEDHNGTKIPPTEISSGESEAAALATEILNFFENIDQTKLNVLGLDEPDVHLHPDMQVRLANFILQEISVFTPQQKEKIVIIIATHSTSLSTAFSVSQDTKIGTKYFDNNIVRPRANSEQFRRAAKFFAHPLSQVISDEPLLIIEGKDDTRVFQQAARTAQGKIKVFPCESDSVDEQHNLETFCNDVLSAIHDEPIAYSLRDGDGRTEPLEDVGCVKRFRLNCYAIENMLLTDDFLQHMNSSWDDFCNKAREYVTRMPEAQRNRIDMLTTLVDSPDRMRHYRIKDIRTLVCVILGSDKPWEVSLGQVIGSINNPLAENHGEHSIVSYIGPAFLVAIGFQTSEAPTIQATPDLN